MSSVGLAEHVQARTPEARVLEWWYASPISEVAPEDVNRLREKLDISPNRPVVLYTGTFEDYQGLPTLIDAIPAVLSRIPQAVFVLVGALPGAWLGAMVSRRTRVESLALILGILIALVACKMWWDLLAPWL